MYNSRCCSFDSSPSLCLSAHETWRKKGRFKAPENSTAALKQVAQCEDDMMKRENPDNIKAGIKELKINSRAQSY